MVIEPTVASVRVTLACIVYSNTVSRSHDYLIIATLNFLRPEKTLWAVSTRIMHLWDINKKKVTCSISKKEININPAPFRFSTDCATGSCLLRSHLSSVFLTFFDLNIERSNDIVILHFSWAFCNALNVFAMAFLFSSYHEYYDLLRKIWKRVPYSRSKVTHIQRGGWPIYKENSNYFSWK